MPDSLKGSLLKDCIYDGIVDLRWGDFPEVTKSGGSIRTKSRTDLLEILDDRLNAASRLTRRQARLLGAEFGGREGPPPTLQVHLA
jgi:hypothetical protein